VARLRNLPHYFTVARSRQDTWPLVASQFLSFPPPPNRHSVLHFRPCAYQEAVAMMERRRFLSTCYGFGLGATLLPGVLWGLAEGQPAITIDMIDKAAAIAGVTIPEDDRQIMLESLNDRAKGYEEIYKLHIANSVAPALVFDPVLASTKFETAKRPMVISEAPALVKSGVPKNLEDLCFATARDLGELVRTRKVSSVALTEMYLGRLKRYDPLLHFVITFTEDRAITKAKEADRDIAAGKYRGPLHGLPWGAKDLLAVAGYPTTWGAGGYESQKFDEDATVVKRLDAAGAVLVAKLSLGALAMDDRWFAAKTRNPWNPAQGSSGSSAGSSSATAAGCVAFSIGSETLGSISSPSTRCGCTGLRPTFGFVPRTGAMALSWSMDKLGPICRSVEDCAIVLHAIYGPDGGDRAVKNAAFNWDAHIDWKKLRVGYLKADFEHPPIGKIAPAKPESELTPEEKEKFDEQMRRREQFLARAAYDRRFTDAAIAKLRQMGVDLVPVEIPKFPYGSITPLLEAEAAASFDDLTRTGRDKLLTGQSPDDWPNTFRTARFMPAVEYVQANRARMMAMEAVAKSFEGFDVIVASTNSIQLVVTNLTGHPAVILPNGFRGEDAPPAVKNDKGEIDGDYGGPGTPVSLTFLGQLYGEGKLLAFARAYQQANDYHLLHPKLPS
jgi:Asp-tRNA(Asn)/Glu-tRNA(Gln) amidotransferase A subunit family amidase